MAAGVLPKIPTILLLTPIFNPATLYALLGILNLDNSAIKALVGSFDHFFDMMARGTINAIDSIKALFGSAEKQSTPLILDLNGDGVQTTGLNSGTYFDHGGDGFTEQTGWGVKAMDCWSWTGIITA